jgi:hypothetical protein
VFTDHSSRPREQRKGVDPAAPEFSSPAVDTPPTRRLPLGAAEKARRIAALRAALAGTAPEFEARVRREREGRPS